MASEDEPVTDFERRNRIVGEDCARMMFAPGRWIRADTNFFMELSSDSVIEFSVPE